MGTKLVTWRRVTRLNWALSFTCLGLMHLGCGGGVVDTPGNTGGGSGNVGTGGMGIGGNTAVACYSPTQNLANVYQPGAKGCTCNPATDASVCVQGVGFVCMGTAWMAVEDGPCMPMPGTGGSGNGGSSNGGSGNGGSTSVIKACGARAGNTCSAAEYCAYQEGEYCGQADAEAVCRPRPQVCDALYSPICGCDGKTYSNSCTAAAAGTGVYANGECMN